MPHLPGACGGEAVLPDYGVPQLQAGMVPSGLHPGTRPFLCPLGKAGAWQQCPAHAASRSLLQQQAFHAGLLCFRCPQCNDREKFLPEMSFLGIQVPARLVLFCPSAALTRQTSCAGPARRLSAQALSPTRGAAERRGEERRGEEERGPQAGTHQTPGTQPSEQGAGCSWI